MPSENTLNSMTGFARVDGSHQQGEQSWRWVWECRSLNNRGLDVKLRLPSMLDFLEADLRTLVPTQINRGSVMLNLQLQSDQPDARPRLDEDALAAVIAAAEKVSNLTDCAPPTADGLLALKGVLVTEEKSLDEDDAAALGAEITTSFQAALEALVAARGEEGARLARVLDGQVSVIDTLTAQATDIAGQNTETIRQRLKDQLRDLQTELPEERLAQEIALLAVKADVREELDRLTAHIASARQLMTQGGPIGRKFDFLVQEFNREANTLCSKAQTIELKQVGLDLKTVIDQMREQIQNVE
ncbi:YicC/YloC family endoribonuclease [Aquisalinus flavus]|nr:YicC/YloC family endoribonuclease [Aquisalinus flavus]